MKIGKTRNYRNGISKKPDNHDVRNKNQMHIESLKIREIKMNGLRNEKNFVVREIKMNGI